MRYGKRKIEGRQAKENKKFIEGKKAILHIKH